MHYGRTYRDDDRGTLDDARKEAAGLQAEIKQGDDALSQSVSRDCYDTFGNMKRAQAWNYERRQLVSKLAVAEQKVHEMSPDNSYRPAPSGFFHGTDG